MIPKIIHCCWFGGKSMPQSVCNYMETWKKYNPDYEIKVWSEDNFDYKSNQYIREAYEMKKWAFVTDYVRLKVLYDFGGIYMDTDVEVLKNLDPLLNNRAFSGFEGPDRLPTGTMGSEKQGKWIELLLKDYDNRPFILADGSLDLTTNVSTITATTKKNFNVHLNNTYQELGDVTFYPFEFLCAKDLKDGKVKKTEDTYTIHHFQGSWTTPKKKVIKFLDKYLGHKFVNAIVTIKHCIKGVDKK